MEDRIRRLLSPVPSLLVGGALLAMFIAERVLNDGPVRIGFDVVAALLRHWFDGRIGVSRDYGCRWNSTYGAYELRTRLERLVDRD